MPKGNNPLGVNQWTGKGRSPKEVAEENRKRALQLRAAAAALRAKAATMRSTAAADKASAARRATNKDGPQVVITAITGGVSQASTNTIARINKQIARDEAVERSHKGSADRKQKLAMASNKAAEYKAKGDRNRDRAKASSTMKFKDLAIVDANRATKDYNVSTKFSQTALAAKRALEAKNKAVKLRAEAKRKSSLSYKVRNLFGAD